MSFERIDNGDETLLKISGTLDALSAPDLRPVVDEIIDAQRRRVRIDASGLRLIDSSGVGVIVSLYKRQRAQNGEFAIEGLRDQPLAIFKLLRLDRVFSF
jgi:anti-sigma B factor antagonist